MELCLLELVVAIILTLLKVSSAQEPREITQCLGNVEFVLVDENRKFSVAKELCEARGGFLGAITSIEEHELVVNLTSELNSSLVDVWIGKHFPELDIEFID